MTPVPTSATRLIALLGNPVAHSLSPAFQNAAFRHMGVDGVYLALRCDADAAPGLIHGIARAGGGGNVTVPHKEVAARAVERATEAVRRTGACNTFWLEEGVICGDNTDVVGCARAMRSLLDRPARAARVLVIGAGGAARGALAALQDEGAGEVVLLARTRSRAEALAERFRSASFAVTVVDGGEIVHSGGYDLVINTTPLGLKEDDADPLPASMIPNVGAALDMAYRPGGTAWVKRLQAAGLPAADGSAMLLWQGVAAFERWWPLAAPVEVMRAAIEEAGA